jgi:hypothetical protein
VKAAVSLLLLHPVTICLTAVQQWCKCGNCKTVRYVPHRQLLNVLLLPQSILTQYRYMYIGHVEMLHCDYRRLVHVAGARDGGGKDE